MIKRYLVAGAAAATLAGGAFAFAANLDVTSNTLASGSSSVDSDCDTLAVDWSPAYNNTSHTYRIDVVDVTGDVACVGETVELAIDLDGDNDGQELAGEIFVLEANGAGTEDDTATASFEDLDLDAADVLHITAISTGADVDPAP